MKLAAVSSGSEKLSPFGKSLDENIFFVMRSWQGSFGSDLSYIPDFDFVTKVNFCHEGLAAVRRDGILSLGIVILLTKIAPVFAPAARRGGCSELAH